MPFACLSESRWALCVSYDGRLYQALKEKYNGSISLENAILEPDEQITSLRNAKI